MRIILNIILISLLSANASAIIVQLSDLHTMASRSDAVFHGIVGEQRVVRDKLGRLITLTDLEVIDGMFGLKTGEVVTIYQVGGEKDGLNMPLIGGQKYNLGQEVLLFGLRLKEAYVSFGAGQGKLDILEHDDKKIAVEDLGNISAISIDEGKAKAYKPASLIYSDLNMLKEEISTILAERIRL